MRDFINQACTFVGGRFDGVSAVLQIPLQFKVGMKVAVGKNTYIVADGPIARCVEQSQEPMTHGIIRLDAEAKQ